jgi:DNA-directed RNA polymerase specialized sigma subunit
MAITLDQKTKLTTEAEKLLIELGGQDPQKILSEGELTTALTQAIETLVERRSPILKKIYRQYELAGEVPPLDK